MGIITKYLCRDFFKLVGVSQLIFVFMYLMIDFLQKIDNFMEADATKDLVLEYLFYTIPHVMVQMAPVAILISIIIMFSLMKKHNEITALKSCGMSVFRLSLPVLAASLGLSIVVFLFSELLVPYASSKSNDIWYREVKKQGERRFYGSNRIWYKGNKAVYRIGRFDGELMAMEDATLYFFNDSFHVHKRIDARSVVWQGNKWRAEDGTMYRLGADGGYTLQKFQEKDLSLPETPEVFLRGVKRPEEMSYWGLKRYARKVRLEGYDITGFLVDMNIKFAVPLIGFVMAFLGIPIALSNKIQSTPLAVSLGMAASFMYFLLLGFARSLGISGILPPILSAWLASAVFLFFGIYFMMHLET